MYILIWMESNKKMLKKISCSLLMRAQKKKPESFVMDFLSSKKVLQATSYIAPVNSGWVVMKFSPRKKNNMLTE